MRRFVPILLIMVLMAVVYFSGAHRYISFEKLRQNHAALQWMVAHYPTLAPLIFIAVYVLSTALSIPGGALLSIFGGFLFPQPFSTFYVVVGATLGATIVFLAAQTSLHNILMDKAGPLVQKMQRGFEEDAVSYLLFLRLIPLFPFWLVNIAPAFFGVNLITFVWTTCLGIIPGAFVLTQAGVGLGAILDAGGELTIETVFNTQVKIALIALGIFALLPACIKKFMKRKRR